MLDGQPSRHLHRSLMALILGQVPLEGGRVAVIVAGPAELTAELVVTDSAYSDLEHLSAIEPVAALLGLGYRNRAGYGAQVAPEGGPDAN